ncbi:flagellar brake protein [Virgibacillus doumboii]|uniref:flagellar brake protein n=1 Tax=Virgibacillus doumboii TaxID=2697503 RepID=UPI0013E031E9|nr:flagellar brake domain-containing protein [Virgibacillus doumboii]
MRIGTLLTIEIKQPNNKETKKYRCKVIEKNEHYIFIDYPIETKTNKTGFLPKGTRFTATYVGKDQSVYLFHTEIVAKVKLNVPALAIYFPDKKDIKKIQRREYVRIETAVDVAFHGTNEPFTTVTSDISGGGMSMIIPNGKNVTTNESADVCIVLKMHSGDYSYVNAQAEVIRVKEDGNKVKTASMKFISVNKQVQQSIIRYCFEKQREARKKELL